MDRNVENKITIEKIGQGSQNGDVHGLGISAVKENGEGNAIKAEVSVGIPQNVGDIAPITINICSKIVVTDVNRASGIEIKKIRRKVWSTNMKEVEVFINGVHYRIDGVGVGYLAAKKVDD